MSLNKFKVNVKYIANGKLLSNRLLNTVLCDNLEESGRRVRTEGT